MPNEKVSPTTAAVERPEEKLLRCCAQTHRDSEGATRVKALLREGIDWAYLLKVARGHGMAPLLFWHLDACCPDAVPEAALVQLRRHFHQNNLRNLSLTGELLGLSKEFEANGIPVVPYKGPVLTASVYGNLALREFIDLDVLVHKQDIPKARELLTTLGYRQQDPLTRSQEAPFLKSQREYVFMHDDSGSVVELHWAVAPRIYSFPLDPESLWGRLERTSLGGGTVPTFSPEDLLLILCAHGSKHFWRRLAWICDVAELIRVREEMDWSWLMEQASTLGSKRMLFLGLFLANDLLGATLPEKVSREMRTDPVVRELLEQVKGWLFREVEGPLKGGPGILAEDPFNESGFHPFRVKVRERLRDKARYCAHTALVPSLEDWQFLPLPGPLYPFYYVLRPIRLAGRYGPRLLAR